MSLAGAGERDTDREMEREGEGETQKERWRERGERDTVLRSFLYQVMHRVMSDHLNRLIRD